MGAQLAPVEAGADLSDAMAMKSTYGWYLQTRFHEQKGYEHLVPCPEQAEEVCAWNTACNGASPAQCRSTRCMYSSRPRSLARMLQPGAEWRVPLATVSPKTRGAVLRFSGLETEITVRHV